MYLSLFICAADVCDEPCLFVDALLASVDVAEWTAEL